MNVEELMQNITHHMNQGLEIDQTMISEQNLQNHFENITQLKFLEPFIQKPNLCEISILGPNECFIKETYSTRKRTEISIFPQLYSIMWEYTAWKANQNWNSLNPFCSFEGQLFGKAVRFSFTHESLNPLGKEKIFIRLLNNKPLALEAFKMSEDSACAIINQLQAKKNILICGETGSGKTSFLNTLLTHIPTEEHLVIMEDLNEITTTNPLHTKLVARAHQGDQQLQKFCRYALRMDPDRLVLGEIRSHEVVPFILSMNSGHRGMLTTLHASGPSEAIHRLCLLFQLYSGLRDMNYQTVMELICRGVDYVIHLESKKVCSMAKIYGQEKGQVLYDYLFSFASEHSNQQIV